MRVLLVVVSLICLLLASVGCDGSDGENTAQAKEKSNKTGDFLRSFAINSFFGSVAQTADSIEGNKALASSVKPKNL